MIEVTRPFLPPIETYEKYLSGIWKRNWLTNNGPLVNELETKLRETLGVKHLLFLSNGTIALQIAIKALKLKGEIITTPFSYVATTSSIVWENCKPVFVDIDPESLNIDPQKIEASITPKTTAILATHVYGNPCDVEAIASIAKRHKLKVIYDAAHCFGTKYKGKSILEYGDISTLSFHATKLFHTVEGGAVVTNNPALNQEMGYLRNFGHDGPDKFQGVGINGKNSEMHAAMGLANLEYLEQILAKRKADHLLYTERLAHLGLDMPKPYAGSEPNYSYYPVLFKSEKDCLAVFEALKQKDIFARRYFYPVLSKLNYVDAIEMPEAEVIAKRILCLPLFYQLKQEELELVCQSVSEALSLV